MAYPFHFPAPAHALIGHRGVAARRLENTLPSFALAAQLGLNTVECDVQRCLSGDLVIFHDETTERLCKEDLRIIDTSYKQLKSLTLKEDAHIPLLEELLTLCHLETSPLNINLEMKCFDNNEEEIAKALVNHINRQWPSHRAPPLVSSFEHNSLEWVRELMPELPLGFLVEAPTPEIVDRCLKEKNCSLNFSIQHYESDFVKGLVRKLPMFVYTVNEKSVYNQLRADGILGIFSDFPTSMGNL